MKIKHSLSIATLIMAGVFATGCSQQSAGGSQVSGGSQSQIEGGSQVAGGSQQASSQQQVEEKVVTPAPTPRAAPAPKPAPVAAPVRRSNGNCHTHPANSMTKSVRHCHPNPTASHRYGGQRRVSHGGGNRWTHTHPAIPHCTKSFRHTHKYKNRNHHHKYQCTQGRRAYHAPAKRHYAPRPAQPKVDVYALQRKLKAKGYYKGPIDGVVGPGTRSALKRFMNK
jgi:transposase-like protein